MTKDKVLIIEDEPSICRLIKTVLKTKNYQIIDARTMKEGMSQFMSHSPDIVILDLGLPDGDGLALIKCIRKEYSTPIIVLTARAEEADMIQALDSGANDYIKKPFSTAELQARVRVAIRGYRRNLDRSYANDKIFKVGELSIDYDKRCVLMSGENIKLTQTEYRIVELLAAYAGKVLTYTDIIKAIWKWSDSGSVKKLQVNMANIRKKMNIKPGENQYILNELGVGYRLKIDTDQE